MKDPNNLDGSLIEKLKAFDWNKQVIDLHRLGIHYFTPEYLPTYIPPQIYFSYLAKGFVPPMALPSAPSNKEVITKWIDENYHKMHNGGIHFLGNEYNIGTEADFDKAKTRVCIFRTTEYETLDGSFGPQLIANFINDFDSSIFVDFAMCPPFSDIGWMLQENIPLLFGIITKRPLTDFDVVILSHSPVTERLNFPILLTKSGIPLYHWERRDSTLPYADYVPYVALAGIGASSAENVLSDNPVKGPAQNAMVDMVLVGEGELLDIKFLQQFRQSVQEDGLSLDEFEKLLTNEHHMGCYNPRKILYEYSDKEHIRTNSVGKELSRTLYRNGGKIKRISIIDEENETLHVIAGPESTETKDLEFMNDIFQNKWVKDPEGQLEQYVTIGVDTYKDKLERLKNEETVVRFVG